MYTFTLAAESTIDLVMLQDTDIAVLTLTCNSGKRGNDFLICSRPNNCELEVEFKRLLLSSYQ